MPAPQDITELFGSGQVHPMQVGKTLDHLAHASATKAVAEGSIPQEQHSAYMARVRSNLSQHTSDLENTAYRAAGNVDAPVSPVELGLKGVEGIGTPYMTGNAIHYGMRAAAPLLHRGSISKLVQKGNTPARARAVVDRAIKTNNPRMTLGGAATHFITPSLPGVAVSQLATLARPLSDPKYKRGERGYLSSWWEAQKGDAERLGQKTEQTAQRYGVAGVPIQMLHGLTNPVSSLIYGGTALNNYFSGNAPRVASSAIDNAVQ